MKINIDRMARLAGLSAGNNTNYSSSRRSLNEGYQHDSMEELDHDQMEESDHDPMEELDHDPMEEVIEIDEVMLVQELRRAKKIMAESKKRRAKQNLQESHLKKIIEEEVQNLFGDMNLNADWMYGSHKPRRSRKGYTAQGSYLKGIGFK